MPAAIDVVARKSSAFRVWLPVIVPPAKTTVEAPGSSVPPTYVQALVVRRVPASVSFPAGLSMTRAGRLPAAVVAAPVNVWATAPSMRSVAAPPPNVEASVRSPCASSVPVPASDPAVSVVTPVAMRLSPAAIAETIVRFRNVSLPGTSIVAADVDRATVPPVAARVPPLWVRLPVTVSVAVVLVNEPADSANGPFTVIALVPPANVPADWLQPPAPTVTVRPADWVIVPV
ncbi:MAG: hypothetical protein E6I94_09415 [Chloroflexi bacterium]|nr:MAG: hypothetical protein E6I94_09415 [Chloroflexota bacterium]